MKEKSITEIIDTDYHTYAMYVLEQRAIPSVIDGMKPVQRKLFYAMKDMGGESKKIKIAELGGGLSGYNYHHGETSACGAAIGMAQEWNNNIPTFTHECNFGSRMVQEAAAPRYIFAKMNPIIKNVFQDDEVCLPSDDIESPEPKQYLPILPWLLVNGSTGIAVGFATNILGRSPVDLIEACEEYIKNNKLPEFIQPRFPSFSGCINQLSHDKWSTHGKYEIVKKNIVRVTELPFCYDRESYFSVLEELVNKDKIQDFSDCCNDTGFSFLITFSHENFQEASKDFEKYLKLVKIHSENYTTLDENGNLMIFQNVGEIIKYFCDFRVVKIKEKVEYDVNILNRDKLFLEIKKDFIERVLSNEINLKKNRLEIYEQLLLITMGDEETSKKLLRTPFHEFCEENVNEISLEIVAKQEKITELLKIDEKELFLKKLLDLKKQLNKLKVWY